MTLETQTPLAQPAGAPKALRLDIADANLMIAGTFTQWVPLLMEGLREDRSVQLLVDITSPERSTEAAVANTNGLLFAFEASDVKPGTNGHRVRGTLSHGTRTAPTEMLLQTARAHTPFAVLSFELPEGFEGLWDTMVKQADDRAAEGETEFRAWGWLRPPVVAAA